MVKSHKKNQKKKLVVKGKGIVNKLNGKCFICNKTKHWAKIIEIRVSNETLQKGLFKPISLMLITLLIKF